jgi:hypothetical protein
LRKPPILYANGHDLKDPMPPPVYGDLQGFPPTILKQLPTLSIEPGFAHLLYWLIVSGAGV